MAKTNKKKVALGVGLGLAAGAAALGAGYYFYGSKHAAGNRQRVASWAKNLQADVLAKAKKLKKFDARAYHAIVDEAIKAYGNIRSINKADLRSLATELKANWRNVEREIHRVAKVEKKVAGRAAKKIAKKVVRIIPRTLGKKVAAKKKR